MNSTEKDTAKGKESEEATPDKEITLITGASSGIGRELARVFAENGHDLFLAARNRERLDALKEELSEGHGVRVLTHSLDLSEAGSPERLAGKLKSQGIEVRNLVNNAGLGDFGIFAESEPDKIREMLMVNIHALTLLTRLLLPGMTQRGKGRILNVGSVAGFIPGPCMAVYFATKAYVLSFSEALSMELKGTGVTVTVLCPGTTDTEFFRRAGLSSNPPGRRGMIDPKTVARAGYNKMMNGQTIVIPGLRNRLLTVLPRFFPRAVVREGVRRVQENCRK